MKFKHGHIYLTENELSKTRGLSATQLMCGHNIVPVLKKVTYLQSVRCPVCQKNTMVLADQSYEDSEDILKGESDEIYSDGRLHG